MPVPVSPIHWKLRPASLQLRFERGNQFARLLVDRAPALEVVIMFRNLEHSFARNVPSAQHVLEEGKYVFLRFRTTKSDHQNGVVIHLKIWTMLTTAAPRRV